jgi:polysaccharide pyruvyl transferase WcaK-like protein
MTQDSTAISLSTGQTDSLHRRLDNDLPAAAEVTRDCEGKPNSQRTTGERSKRTAVKISLFGAFGHGNFGNDSTLAAILYHLWRRIPNAEITCVCTGTEAVAAAYNVRAVPISSFVAKVSRFRNPLARWLRKVFVGLPSELYRCLKVFETLRGTDVLIITGTGLLTDALGHVDWGPYNVLKWSLIAKLCRCKLLFVSVGAGPIYGAVGRLLVKAALCLADFRSYRENSTVEYLSSIGFRAEADPVYPDLAFSFPEPLIPREPVKGRRRKIVGVGVMPYAGRYSAERPSDGLHQEYLDNLAIFAEWLIAHEYDVRLLIGDIGDRPIAEELKSMLAQRLSAANLGRVLHEPVFTVEQLLSQLAATDLVVATRFHNILLALLVNKPVISISFHHKCVSLMRRMGLSEYCQDIHELKADWLIEQFCRIERNAGILKPMIRQRAEGYREALDVQYDLIVGQLAPR